MAWEGHFRPLVPLAHALATRGHEVVFAAASAWEPRVAEEGFALFPAGLTRAEGGERFAPFRAKIFALPPEGRRTHQFSKLFGMIHAPAKLPELLGVGAPGMPMRSCMTAVTSRLRSPQPRSGYRL